MKCVKYFFFGFSSTLSYVKRRRRRKRKLTEYSFGMFLSLLVSNELHEEERMQETQNINVYGIVACVCKCVLFFFLHLALSFSFACICSWFQWSFHSFWYASHFFFHLLTKKSSKPWSLSSRRSLSCSLCSFLFLLKRQQMFAVYIPCENICIEPQIYERIVHLMKWNLPNT